MTLLDLLFPKRCLGCNQLGAYICIGCRKTLVRRDMRCGECDRPAIDGMTHPRCKRPYGVDGLVTVFVNRHVIKKAIKSLKYRFVHDAAEELIDLIPISVWKILRLQTRDFVFYPIPLHPDRLRWRGFNQAEKLGRYVVKKLGVQMVDGLLKRKEKRIPQADIKRLDDRIKNAQGLFSFCSNNEATKPQSLLLFDDVWTTGATMKEAAKVLKRNGIEKVWCLTLAR